MRSRTPSVNGSVCPSPYGSMHKKVNFPIYSVPLSLSFATSKPKRVFKCLHQHFFLFQIRHNQLTILLCNCSSLFSSVIILALFSTNVKSWPDPTRLWQKESCTSRRHHSFVHLQLLDGRAYHGLFKETNRSLRSATKVAPFPPTSG